MACEQDYDIAIAGLGPTGAIAAALLGQTGLRILVIDKSQTIYDKPRAVGMDHEIMRVFQNIGVANRVQPLTAPFTTSEHYGADGQLIRRVGMLPPPYPMGWTPTMAFRQPQVEQILRDRLGELPSVEVRLGVEMVGMTQDADGVNLELHAGENAKQVKRAGYLIGCDGASSTVRRLAGIALDDLGFDEPWLVIDLLVNDSGLEKLPMVNTHFCEPARPSLFVVCTGNHRRWEMMLLPGEDPREMEREDQVWKLLSRWITPQDAELWRSASYRFHAVVAAQWRNGRVFLAGDAAHQQPPFLGQGLCQGIRDVRNLVWKLQHIISGDGGATLLDSYEQERSAHVRSLIETIKGIGRYICELNHALARARDTRMLEASGGIVKTLIRQELMPGLTSGFFSGQSHPARGTLMPQPYVLKNGHPVLLDDAAGSGWRVVLGENTAGWDVKVTNLLNVIRLSQVPIDGALQETDGVLAAWMDHHSCAAAIVRPDHYVYAVASDAANLAEEIAILETRLVVANKNRPNSNAKQLSLRRACKAGMAVCDSFGAKVCTILRCSNRLLAPMA